MQVSPTVDASRCPLCGQSNRCAMEVQRASGVTQGPCWCAQVSFETKLLSAVPEPLRGKACICPVCSRANAASS